MKTAIYIEDGVVQLVITPETEFEKNAVSTFRNQELKVEIFSGSFYDCRGGWVRQTQYNIYYTENNDDSIILKVKTDS